MRTHAHYLTHIIEKQVLAQRIRELEEENKMKAEENERQRMESEQVRRERVARRERKPHASTCVLNV